MRSALLLPAAAFRMGSFTSKPQVASSAGQDDSVQPPVGASHDEILEWVRGHLVKLPPQLQRHYRHTPGPSLSSLHTSTAPPAATFRLMQWNVLAQALGAHADNFVMCPKEALCWDTRRFRILEEILVHQPDIVCLQEVDHFSLLERVLGSQGYEGFFVPKPDSPCIYVPENSGPDGCALFYRTAKFKLIEQHSRILEVWRVQSNQVALLVTLRERQSQREFTVLTTHLKAKQGALLASLRNEQGKDLLEFLEQHRGGRPAVLCGDLNAEPSEPVYATLTQAPSLALSSAYATVNNGEEPPYSTWKIRGNGESKHNIDYVLYTSEGSSVLQVLGSLDHPSEEALGPGRAPSLAYPSDHFSLVCDFALPELSDDAQEERNHRSR
ncbi:nocturnin-like isoform X2 [Hyalella azteca]|uniref:Nocturnin n=1 Tax=Hyalella azteca TaxID=294128 RepID=A0A8B7NIW9_HYAAZ|nr:nocturnin-like isoform X2 [Hyalella azteca]